MLTSTEEAVRGKPAGSIDPKDLRVTVVGLGAVAPLIVEHHYLHSAGAAASRCYGVRAPDGALVGAAILGPGSSHAYRLLHGGRPQHVITLARFWLDEACGRNAESRVLAIVLRDLRRERRWKLLITYADPVAGHTGTIYRAAGFAYLGLTQAEAYLEFADGTLHHRRSMSSGYGSNHLGHLARTGILARRVPSPPKYRYGAILDPAWAWRLSVARLPYPAHPGTAS